VTAVVVTFNSAHCIGACLRGIADALRPLEVVVVDNASADETIATARAALPDVVVVESEKNLGFGRACNLGVARSRGEFVLFVNPDVELQRVDAEALQADLELEPLGLLVPLLGTPDAAPRHHVFPYRRWPAAVTRQAWKPLRPRELRRPRRQASSTDRAWAAAPLLLVRRDEFLAVGGFDERYFLYAEDVDLSRRYRRAGLPLRLTAALVGTHAGGSSSAGDDGPRVVPDGWSLLGTLQYVSVWEGDRVAARAARMLLWTFALQRLILSAAARLPVVARRARRKVREIDALEAFVVERANPATGDGDECPDAVAAVRRAWRLG
jgi:GT2 family glycosyltransferase